ncbi:MAG: hypothetical protein C7B46_18580 [Sulfobacillus benefaciens]|uniref:Uncharacterized protein n=1 Tax=Sulfobacillus benefaciens TaxID=453960 RepID=A0A2T2X4Y8_9FIRM|nr:MAG: hypothetical protein C7B46_18580 [Sulfobacillus benefaciens]
MACGLLPIFLIQAWRETGHWRFGRLLSAVAAEGVVILGQSLLNPSQRLTSLKYLLYRPVNIASTPGVLARWLGDHHLVFSYGAVNVLGALPMDLATGIFLLGALLGLGILWLLAKGKITLTGASILAVGLLLVAMKVSSPQYLIWWAPLLALRRGTPILPFAFALTMLAYPLEAMMGLESLNLPTLTMVFLLLILGLVQLFLHRDPDVKSLSQDLSI